MEEKTRLTAFRLTETEIAQLDSLIKKLEVSDRTQVLRKLIKTAVVKPATVEFIDDRKKVLA